MGEHPQLLPDGRVLCLALAQDPLTSHIPFLAVTSRAFPREVEDARHGHPFGVRIKPTDTLELVQDLLQLAGQPR